MITDVARGVGHDRVNLYDGIADQLEEPMALPPTYLGAYGPVAYYPLFAYHVVLDAIGLEDRVGCDAACELKRAPVRWAVLAKLPYLAVDVAVTLAALVLLPGHRGRRLALLWSTSPAIFFTTYLMGQIDIVLAGSIVVGALLMLAGRHPPPSPSWLRRYGSDLAMVAFGLGAATKMLPLFVAVGLIAALRRTWKDAVRWSAMLFGTIVVAYLPFLGSDYFLRSQVFTSRGLELLTAEIGLVSPLLVLAAAPIIVLRNRLGASRVVVLLGSVLSVCSGLALFTNESPQRGMYVAVATMLVAGITGRGLAAALLANALTLVHPLIGRGLGVELVAPVSVEVSRISTFAELLGPTGGSGLRVLAHSIGFLAAMVSLVALARRDVRVRARSVFLTAALSIATPLVLLAMIVLPATSGLEGPDAAASRAPVVPTTDHVQQRFVAALPRLSAIEVFVDPAGRNLGGDLRLRILDGCDGAVLRTASFDAIGLFDGVADWVRFDFARLDGPAGRELCLDLDLADVGEGGRPALFRATSKPGASADPAGSVLVFRDRYDFPVRSALDAFGRAARQDAVAVIASILSSAAAAAGIVAVAARRRRPGPELPSG